MLGLLQVRSLEPHLSLIVSRPVVILLVVEMVCFFQLSFRNVGESLGHTRARWPPAYESVVPGERRRIRALQYGS